MTRRRWRSIGLIVVILGAGCAPAFLKSGETLDTLGKQFVAVGQHYNALYESKKITAVQYAEWSGFAKRFQRAYPIAVDAWKIARASGDQAAEKKMEEALITLAAGLTPLAIKAYEYAAKEQ
mgnify:CR=1 FL=1